MFLRLFNQIHLYFCWKNKISFCTAKASHIFSTKQIGIFGILTFEILTSRSLTTSLVLNNRAQVFRELRIWQVISSYFSKTKITINKWHQAPESVLLAVGCDSPSFRSICPETSTRMTRIRRNGAGHPDAAMPLKIAQTGLNIILFPMTIYLKIKVFGQKVLRERCSPR